MARLFKSDIYRIIDISFHSMWGAISNPRCAFSLRYTMSSLAAGQWTEELVYQDPKHKIGEEEIFRIRDSLFSAPNLGTAVPGSVPLRAATNFITPEGWDAVYSGVFNNLSVPCLPVLSVRVETDWFAFDSEFRYVLQAGDSIGAGPGDPIGQVFFVPRDSISLRKGTVEDSEIFQARFDKYQKEKRADHVQTPTGFKYSPVYQKRMDKKK